MGLSSVMVNTCTTCLGSGFVGGNKCYGCIGYGRLTLKGKIIKCYNAVQY